MNYLDAVYYAKGIGRRKEEPQQPEKEEKESNIILDALDSATRFMPPRIAYDIATSAVTPLLGGTIAETAGNVLQALGDPDRTLAARYSPNMQKLRDMGDYAQEIADDLLQAGLDKVKPADNDTYSGALRNAFQGGAYGVLQGDASMIHSDKSANAFAQAIKQLQDENPVEAELSLDYLTSPHGMTRDFGNVTGSMAAILPAMLAMPESVAARGAAKLGGDALTRYLINQGRYGAAKQFARRAPEIFRYSTTSAPAEGIAEGGHVRADALEQGLSEEEATQRSIDTMLANTALLAGTNTLEGFLLGAPNIASSLGRKAMQGLARGGLNMGVQGTEEALQKAISNANTDKPYGIAPQNWTPDQWQEFKAAFGGTAPMAFVAGAGHMASRPNTNEQNWNRGSQRDISNEDYKNIAQNVSDFKLEDDLRSWTDKISGGKMSDKVFNSILYHARKNGIPAKIALAQAIAESNGDQNVTSEAGAIGVMQLMPETAESLGVDPYDQEQNIRGGMKYLKDMYDQFGDWNLALAAYNAGAGAVQKYGGIPNYSETQNYVAKINGFLDESPYYNDDVNNNVRSTGIHYLGDNGKGEGNTWQRQNDNVSLDGAQPDLLNAIDVLGKWFYDRTGKKLVVTAGTNGKHADGEHSHTAGWKVDVNDWDGESDGYLVTADGSKGSLTDEFIKFGQSIGLGMNWEGDHIDVALDGTQWDGTTETTNFGGFKRWRESPKRQSTQPSQEEESSQQAPPKPLFDINREDNQAQDIFKQFAEEKALNSNTNEEIDFFDGMFDADGIFQNTKENRDAIRKNYADEFISFAQNTIPAEQPQQIQPTQPAPIQSPKVQAQPKIEEQKIETPPEDSLLNNDDLKGRMIKYLQSLESTPENDDFRFEIGKAWDDGNQEKVRQMLESRGVSTTPIQPDPVTKNKPPENVLPKPKEKLSGQEKIINVATKVVPVGNKHVKARKKQGKALMELATQNNIEIPQPEIIALQNGSTKAVQKWRDELLKRGLSSAPQAQETSQQENSQMQTPQENSVSAKILQARKARTEQENKARAIASRLLNMSEDDESFVKRESPKQSKTPYEPWEDLSELSREHDITGTSYEKELQQRQAEEERQRQWKAKQDRELAELKARQTENKRLAEARRKMDEEKVAQQAAEEKQRQVENVQSTLGSQDTALQRQITFALSEPSANKQEREKQGNALLNLLERPEIKYAISDIRIVNSLKPSLKVGAKPAIIKAQEILNGIEAPEQQINRPVEKIREVKSPIQLEQERRRREQKKQQRQWELAQRREDEELQQEIEQEEEDSRRQKIIEQDEFEDELQFEDEMQETKMRRSEDLEELFDNQEKSAPQEQEQSLTQEEIDKRLSQLGQISQEEADEYLNDITKQIQPQSEKIKKPSEIQSTKTQNTVLFKRNGMDSTEIQEGRKTIKNAPDGTKIRGKWIGLGVNSESQYIIQKGKLQLLDENGYRDGKAVKLSSENIRKHFGQPSLAELELTYPENEEIKSQEKAPSGRVRNSDEVFTPPDKVNHILDLTEKEEPDMFTDPQKTYLDPTAGEGAITTEVLRRKLNNQAKAENKSIGELQMAMLRALSSVYSVELMEDNVGELRKNMQQVFLDHYRQQTGKELHKSSKLFKKMSDIINANNIQGDFLELTKGNVEKLDEAFKDWKDEDFSLGDAVIKPKVESPEIDDSTPDDNTRLERLKPEIEKYFAFGEFENQEDGSKYQGVMLKNESFLENLSDEAFSELSSTLSAGALRNNGVKLRPYLRRTDGGKGRGLLSFIFSTLEDAQSYAAQTLDSVRKESQRQETNNLKAKEAKRQAIPKTEDNAKPTPQQAEKPHEESDKELDAKAKKFFEKFEKQDNQGKPLIGATLKFSVFPTPEDVEKSTPITDGVDGIAKKHGGRYGGAIDGYGWNYHFKTTEDRDNFIRSVMNSGVLEAEIDRQQKAIQEREKAVTEYKNKIEKIIDDAKEKAYEILEADKYPEIKDFVNRQIQNRIETIIMTDDVAKAQAFADKLIKSVKSYKADGMLANGVLFENLKRWEAEKRGDNRRPSKKQMEKYGKAEDIIGQLIEQYKKGEVTLEDARKDLNYFLETGRRRKESKSSKTRKTSEEQINEAAKNPDTAEAKKKTVEEKSNPHKMPKFIEQGTITAEDLKNLVNQAWDKAMKIDLNLIYSDFESNGGRDTAPYYKKMESVFKTRANEELAKSLDTEKIPQNIEDCKSIKELENYWRSKHNPRIVFHSKLKELYFPAVKETLKGFEKVFELFPKIHSRLMEINPFALAFAIATMETSPYLVDSRLKLNYDSYKTKESVADFSKGELRKPVNIGTHEATHFLMDRLLHRAGFVSPSATLVSDLPTWHDSALLYWASELLSSDKKTKLWNFELDNELEKISKAARIYDRREAIAEAIASVSDLGEKAPPLAKAILQRIKEGLTGDTWRERLVISKPYSRLPKFADGNINTATVAKWYNARKAEKKKFSTIRSQAEKLLYDRSLAEELSKIKSQSNWEQLLRERIPNEEILEQENWSNEKINELAKESSIKNVIKQLGGEIKDGKVTLNEEDKAAFIRHMETMIDPTARYSQEGGKGNPVDTTIRNYVDQKDLTPQQKLLQDFGRKLGARVISFKGDSRFHGQHSNGITYLNVDSNMTLGKVFWHESMHWLKANNSKLYQQLAKAVGITDEQRQAYLDRTERNDLPTDEAIDEEIIADQFEDVAKRSGLLQSISGKNRGLIGRVIQWLQDTMKKFVDYFRNPQGKLTTAQAQALTDEFGKIANGLVDSSGEKIFRYNRRTHNTELADGRDWNSSVEHSDNRGAFSLQPKYSIDASDNSNESTLQRIRNKITAFIGSSDAPSKRRNKRITQFLEKLADIRIVAGHIKGAKNIDVDEFHRLLKSRKAYDWENILPEIGGMLAKSLNLNDSPEMRNYFTDWLLTGAPNNNSAEAKAFQQAARNNPAMFEILQNIRNEFDEIQNLSAEEFYGEKIIDKPPEKTLAEHLGYYKDNWKEEFIDDLHPINRMFEQVVAKAEKTNPKLAKWLKETVNPYEMARLFRGIDSVAEIMIGKIGTSPSERINEIRANLAQAFPNVNFSRFKPIAMILEEVGALNDKKTRRAFESYCVAKLDKEMHEKKNEDPEKYGYLQPLGTEEQADAMIAKYEKQFGQAQKDLVLYSNTMLTIMYDAGVLTKNKYSEILHSWKNYIPTARVFDENEEYDFVNSFKQKTGSNRDVWSPLQKMIANTTSLIKQAERNKVKCQIAQLARCGQFGQIIAETDNPHPNTGTAVSFYEFGKKHWLETPDTSIVRALSAIQSQKDGAWIVKAFNAVMSWFKGLQTFWNPDFSAGNIFRDSAAAYIHNKHLGYANPFMFFADVARIGFKGFWKKDANWIEWKAMGGAQSSYVSEDVDYVQRSISDLTETGLESFKKHPLSYLLDRLQYIAEASETATRLTTYVKARDALAAQRSDGKATLDDKRHAALASRNATIDFAKAGTSTRKANRVFAFANAAVQDFALQAETFSPAKIQKAMKGDKQAQQQIFSAGFRLLAMGVIPTLIQFALMHRDDDKKKIYSDLHDWEKETYWYFGDLIHIPKSMDIGIRLTSAITDEFLKTAIDKDPAEWKRFRRLILDAAPGLTATLFTPLIETYANYSLFRDAPIVPAKEQHLPGHLQYGYDTSSVAKIISDNTISIAKIFGAETGFSPRKIDYLINGYLGFMGRFVSHIPNYAGRGGISLDEIPIARRFLYEPYKNPKIVKDYYEALDEQASLYNGYKLELQQGKKVKPPEDFDPALYQRLKVAQESMRKLSNLEKRIQTDEKLSDSQRKEKLRELELRRVALCEKVFNKAR